MPTFKLTELLQAPEFLLAFGYIRDMITIDDLI